MEIGTIYHNRIRSHVLLCWLALLLSRIAEVEKGQSCPSIRGQMQQQNLVELFGKNGRVLQHTETTQNQRIFLKKMKLTPPKPILITEIPV